MSLFSWMQYPILPIAPQGCSRYDLLLAQSTFEPADWLFEKSLCAADDWTRVAQVTHAACNDKWNDLLEASRSVPLPGEASRPEFLPRLWVLHFKICVLNTLGRADEALTWDAEFAKYAALEESLPVLLEREFDRCRELISRGELPAALQILNLLRQSSKKQPFSNYSLFLCEMLSGSICSMLGKVAEAKACLRRQAAIAEKYPLPMLEHSLLRREFSLLIETEQFAKAKHMLKKTEVFYQRKASPLLEVLFDQMKLRLAIICAPRCELVRLQEKLLKKLAATSEALGSSQFADDLCELELRLGHNQKNAEAAFQSRLVETRRKGNTASESSICLSLARLYKSKGKLVFAHKYAKEAVALAEEVRLGKLRVKAYLFLAGLEINLGNRELARLLIRSAESLAHDYHLPLQKACAKVLQSSATNGKMSLSLLLSQYSLTRSFSEIEYYATVYGFELPKSVQFSLYCTASKKHSINDVFPLMQPRTFLWFPLERAMYRYTENSLSEIYFSPETRAIFAAIFKVGQQGIRLEEIFLLFSNGAPMLVERHYERAKSYVSKARSELKLRGIKVAFCDTKQTYRLESEYTLCELIPDFENAQMKTELPRILTSTDIKIFEFIEQRIKVTSHELIHHFNVTRQTLHPRLKRLQKQGFIKRKNNGKASAYVVAGGSGPNALFHKNTSSATTPF